ncbi:hypothetical protein DFH07DRAFT_784817 [Mycena maculata]|uniref:Uncharacterized protein n=1 Tax=Mycena maculata TaxID=230809 RepID=A0AAD7HEA6_9AGAR|nr:hypothetical protein DFH07DRAFT_784817 [Mycena maculata]
MAKGHTHKKIKTHRKNKRARLNRQYELRSAATHAQTTAFLGCNELILYHLFEACTLVTLISLSHTSRQFRVLVKTLFRLRLIGLVKLFVGHHNVQDFFHLLEVTDAAIGGSTLLHVLAPPIGDEVDDWTPNNLNLFVPFEHSDPWDAFFRGIKLRPIGIQPGVTRPYKSVTKSHIEYTSRLQEKTSPSPKVSTSV